MIISYIIWAIIFYKIIDKGNELNSESNSYTHYSLSISGFETNIKKVDSSNTEDDYIQNALYEILSEINVSKYEENSFKDAIFIYDIDEYKDIFNKKKELKSKRALLQNYFEYLKNKNENSKFKEIDVNDFDRKCPETDIINTAVRIQSNILFCSCFNSTYSIEKINKNMKELNDEEENYLNRIKEKRISRCIITFKHPDVRKDVLKEYNRGKIKKLIIKKVSGPDDLLYDNLHVSYSRKILGLIVIWGITLLLLIICTLINTIFTRLKIYYSSLSTTYYALILILITLFTLIENNALTIIIPWLTKYERLETRTSYQASVSFKLAITIFLNSAIIPLISYNIESYFHSDGLIQTIWINWVLLAILPSILEIINLSYILNRIRCWWLDKNKYEIYFSQLELNKIYEGISIQFLDKYAEVCALLFFTAFYISFIPIASLITMIVLVLFYWVNKILLLRRSKMPDPLSRNITKISLIFIGIGCLTLFTVF